MSRNIVLAGPMGAGKTAVARLLAGWLDRQFVDTDALISSAKGKPLTRIFAEDGEAGFRALEADAITAVCERSDLVVSVGGGAVVDPINAAKLRERARVVLLDATPEVLAKRVEGGRRTGQRPLLDDAEDVVGRIAALKDERAEAYARAAHATFDTTDVPLEKVGASVLAWVEEVEELEASGAPDGDREAGGER